MELEHSHPPFRAAAVLAATWAAALALSVAAVLIAATAFVVAATLWSGPVDGLTVIGVVVVTIVYAGPGVLAGSVALLALSARTRGPRAAVAMALVAAAISAGPLSLLWSAVT